MRHTDFSPLYSAIKRIEEIELIHAVQAHGGSYRFCDNGRPIILGSWKHADVTEDYAITHLTVEDGWLTVYGYPYHGGSPDDVEPVYYIEPGQMSFIMDDMMGDDVSLPETVWQDAIAQAIGVISFRQNSPCNF